jgi:hypothetical protein
MRIDLICSYDDRHAAKLLGARWDSEKKVWYVVNPKNITLFARWVSEEVMKKYKPKKKKVLKKKEVEPHIKKFQRFINDMDQHMRSI